MNEGRPPHLHPDVVAPAPAAPQPAPKKLKTLRGNPFPNDDGSQPPEFAAAKAVQPPERTPAVVRTLVAGRVLVPVLPHAAPANPHHKDEADESCDAPPSILMELPDGRHAMPAFTSMAAMAAWDPQARPVPMYGAQAAQAAYEQGDGLMLLDPTDEAVLIPRPAVWALAIGTEWVPAWRDRELGAVAAEALVGIAGTRGVALMPGRTAEVAAVILVDDGLERPALEASMNAAATALSTHAVLRDRIDSLEIVPTTKAAFEGQQ